MTTFKRILLKLSGESLAGRQGHGIDVARLTDYATQIKEARDMGVQVGIVIGGGNIFRGLSGAGKGFDRVMGDQMGMCATVINSLAYARRCGRPECPAVCLRLSAWSLSVSFTPSGKPSRPWNVARW